MFTADLQPDNPAYTKVVIGHIKYLKDHGYTGFDLPIAPTAQDHRIEVQNYQKLRDAFDAAGLTDVHFTTNVGATRTFDPSSMYTQQRDIALAYLKSRVDITKALRGDVMAGPIITPYGIFPTSDSNQPIWSDALQDWAKVRYHNALPVFKQLGGYAASQGVKLAIEPVDHWETAPPNLVREVVDFTEQVANESVGVCIDSAHVVLGSDGPPAFTDEVKRVLAKRVLHYVHISAPDRGAVHESWIPWKTFLTPICAGAYKGPFLVEVFNAIPVFLNSLRLARRKFWIPGEDAPEPGRPSAYTIAEKALAAVHAELGAAGCA